MLVHEIRVRWGDGLKLNELSELLHPVEMDSHLAPQEQTPVLGDHDAYPDRVR